MLYKHFKTEETANQTESHQIKFLVFGERGNRSTGGKTSRDREKKKQKTQPMYGVKDGIKPRPLWWKASALTTAQTVSASKKSSSKYNLMKKKRSKFNLSN